MDNIGFLFSNYEINEEEKPFGDQYLNETYSDFSKLGSERGLKIILARFEWYEGEKLEKGWIQDEGWRKVENPEIEGVFDKFKFGEDTRKLKQRIKRQVGIINDPELEEICKDKLLTYEEFSDAVPETREATEENLSEFLQRDGKAVLKPRYGFGGDGVSVVESVDQLEDEDLVQRFVEPGESEVLDLEGYHDLRLIFVNEELVLSYVRTPDEGFVSNIAQGGEMRYLELNQVPEEALNVAEPVRKKFSQFKPNLYSVDLMLDSSGEFRVIELNSKPGIGFRHPEEVKKFELPAMKSLVDAMEDLV